MKKLLSILLLAFGLPVMAGAIQNTVIQTGFNNFQAPTGCGTNGYVLSTDGNCVTSWTATSATNVLGTTLTGFVSGAGTVSSADTVLSAFNKINGNVAAIPSYTAGQFPAVTDGSDASIGNVGVFFSSAATDGGAPNGSYEDITSFVLPAGDWDITEICHVDGTGGSSVSNWIVGISTTTGNDGAGLVESYSKATLGIIGAAIANSTIPRYRANYSTSKQIYAKSFAAWTGGSGPSVKCGITARSAR